jgi:hypothetical protein
MLHDEHAYDRRDERALCIVLVLTWFLALARMLDFVVTRTPFDAEAGLATLALVLTSCALPPTIRRCFAR